MSVIIASNKAIQGVTYGIDYCYSSVSTGSDVTVSGALKAGLTGSVVGLIARCNGVSYVVNSAGSCIYANIVTATSLEIGMIQNGVTTILRSDTTKNGSVAGTTYSCQLVCKGNTAIFYTPLGTIEASIPTSTNTRCGFIVGNSAGVDTFLVQNYRY